MNIFKRNKQILFTGIGLGVFFILVIFISFNEKSETQLNQVNEIPNSSTESPFSVSERKPNIIDEGGNKNLVPNQELVDKLSNNTAKTIFVFTNEGWGPKSSSIANNEYVKWVNLSDRDIVVRELVSGQIDFRQPVTIKPNDTFQTQLKRIPPTGYWTFEEVKSGSIGRVYVYPD